MLLKFYREQKGLTQEEVSIHIGVSLRQYQRFESGERFPKREPLMKLEDLFGVPQRILLAKSAEEIPDYLKQYIS